MKRKLLFVFAMALLGFSNSWAQKDVTNLYITNATLSDGLNGWTNVNFNAPQKGNNTIGYASECYAGWGTLEKTEYGLTQKITLPAGNYTLVNYSFFRYGLNADTDPAKSLAFLKAGDNKVAIQTLGSIHANGYANSQSEGANVFDSKMYRNTVDFTIAADGTEIEIGLYGTFDLKQSWIIAGMFELINNDILATMDSPFDVTGYLTNPGLEYRDMSGWTLTNKADGDPSNGYIFQAQGNSAFGNKAGNCYGEAWQASGALSDREMSQSLSGLPNGLYLLSAYVSYGSDGAYLFLNDKKTAIEADNAKKYTVGLVVNDGALNVGMGLVGGTKNYLAFDRFTLQYCGDVAAALTGLVDKLDNYKDKIPTAAYTKLETDVKAYDKTYSDVDELLAAIDAINGLYDDADKLLEPYANWQLTKAAAVEIAGNDATMNTQIEGFDARVEAATTAEGITKVVNIVNELLSGYDLCYQAKALAAVPYVELEAGANETFKAAVTTQVNAAFIAASGDDEATAIAGIDDAFAKVKEAMVTYVSNADPQEGYQFDMTFLVTTPDVTNLWDGTWWVTPDGWYNEQEGGNFQVMQNGSVDAEDNVHKVFTEYYYLSDGKTWGNGKFNLYTKVALPKGTYEMSCYAFAKEENYSSGDPKPRVFFYANDTQGSNVNSSRLTKQSISFVTDKEQDVKIGLKPLEGNTYNWMGIGYVELYKQFTDYTEYGITLVSDEFDATLTTTGSKNKSMALKTVTVNVEIPEGMNVEVTAEELDENGDPAGFIDVANPEAGVYTYQQPRANVKVTVQREKKEIVVKLYKPTEGSSETHGMSTFIAPYDVDISDKKYDKDIQAAYTVDGAENGELVLTEVEDGLIPAYTPVILECKKTKSVIEVTFNDNVIDPKKVEKQAPYTEGLLTGVLTETDAPVGKYVLQNQDDGLAFYRVDKEKTIKVPAYKAYLTMEGSAAKAIFFPGEDEEANAIAALDVLTSGYDAIYTANGVKVNALQKGLNIVKKGDKSYKIFVK